MDYDTVLRENALDRATSLATPGETAKETLERAEAFYAFLIKSAPMQPEESAP